MSAIMVRLQLLCKIFRMVTKQPLNRFWHKNVVLAKKKNVKMYCMSVDQWNFTCIIFKHHMVILFFVAFYILSVCNVKLLSGALCFIMCIMFTLLPVVIPNQSFHHQSKRIQFAGNNFRAFKTVNLSCGLIMSILSEIIPFNENILNLHQMSADIFAFSTKTYRQHASSTQWR